MEALLRGRRMALCLPCGDGARLEELRALDVPAVGVDVDPAAVQRCRERGFVAYVATWRDLAAHRQRFDAVLVDAQALGLASPGDLADLAAVLDGALLPGGLLFALGDPAPWAASRALWSRDLLPVDTGPARTVLQKRPVARPPSPGLVVGPYADVFVGCERVFEIGAGSGRMLDALAMRDLHVAGCEQDQMRAAAARERGLAVLRGGLEAAHGGGQPFGGVFVGHVVERLSPDQLALLLAVARRLLRPGGRFLVRARADAACFEIVRRLAAVHGFPVFRRGTAPGDARDSFAVLLANDDGPPSTPAAPPEALAAVALPTGDTPIEQPLGSLFDLERFERRVTSQCGEDGVLEAIFARIGATNRQYVEFGCGDGVQCNTAALRRRGWRGLLMDGVAAPGAPDVRMHAAWITAENIESLFDAHDVPQEPDLMSIDLDGNDWWVWRAVERRPRVVVAEYNANLGPALALTIPYDPQHGWDGTDFYGASLPALVKLGRRKGYTLVHCTQSGVNAFFVRDDLLREEARDPAAIWRPPNYWYRSARQYPNLARQWVEVDDALLGA